MASSSALRRRWAEILIPRMISNGGSKLSWNSCRGSKLGGDRMMSTDESSRMCPWLLLPPPAQGGYKYYSLGEKRVLTIEAETTESESESELQESESEFVGSSHGWVALLNKANNDVFLSNPISRRRIKLPPVGRVSYTRGWPRVSKVILSSPPDSRKCRAVMTFGPGNRMAFCSLKFERRSWEPLGDLFFVEDPLPDPDHSRARVYEDIICCDRRGVLTGITPVEFDLVSFQLQLDFECQVEIWDITHPRLAFWESDRGDTSPETLRMNFFTVGENTNTLRWVVKNIGVLEKQCIQIPHLVFTSDELYLVMRFVALIGPDGLHLQQVPCCPIRGLKGHYPCQTLGFVALKLSRDGCYEVVDDLDGMAMFVGLNNSFAIPASRFPELKPNSIYFTDAKRLGTLNGVADTGIFDYQTKSISPIIIGEEEEGDYPLHSSPIWFYPTTS